ncbi:capsule biosynthesis GfcC family protein [Candidatus Sodalis endolongispinus]|uniref:Capsule biosynthesis GfcC family protein n=1 Tax=Candidatus Sodalis endolongispinus TaxID=2812662 RepID=A0ABS5YBS7_9GAMM|nr:capsule biosynthesis GfcC family protein [Candidatus Sodalis endolongispinus]MBT9432152.1 capsule biosynthesis GfcC family protein [Candidatus Sodalis endolongispinus]
MKKQLLVAVSLCAGFIASAMADSRVAIHYPGQSQALVLQGAANLEQLTLRPGLNGRTWWPGTVIAERTASGIQQQAQQQLLARLSAFSAALLGDNDGELADSVDRVRAQLAAMRVTGRQFVPLDPDWIRLHAEANRRLSGEYSVYTLSRPTSIQVVGVTTPAGPQPYQPGRDVAEYLQTHQRLSGAEKNVVWVIQPDGKTEKVPVAYWNHRHVEVAPGSIIYVGFSSWSLPRAYRDVNEQIVSLLTHRIPD